jgi:hypothetical protein
VHPNFLALVGDPPEVFCLPPNFEQLPYLAERWCRRIPDPHLVDRACTASFDRAAAGRSWLNRWEEGLPSGLWLWSWRSGSDTTPLNGGNAFTRYVWAIYGASGSVISVRWSCSRSTTSPPGYHLGSQDCPWTFIERSWSSEDDEDAVIGNAIDCADPLYPQVYVRRDSR